MSRKTGTYSVGSARAGLISVSLPRQCYNECPPGSTSQAGSKSLLDCKCKHEEGFTGPDGGPCARTREGVASFAEGTVWVFGSDNFSSAARRLNLPLTPQPRPRMMDDALRRDLEAWPIDAARFWAQQGDAADPFPWSLRNALYRMWWAVWPWEQAEIPKSTPCRVSM